MALTFPLPLAVAIVTVTGGIDIALLLAPFPLPFPVLLLPLLPMVFLFLIKKHPGPFLKTRRAGTLGGGLIVFTVLPVFELFLYLLKDLFKDISMQVA